MRPESTTRRRRVRGVYVVVERRGLVGWLVGGGSTSLGGGARPRTSVMGRHASRSFPSSLKNTSDKNSKAVLRISVITLIRTDTTLAARGHARDASRAGSDAAKRTS